MKFSSTNNLTQSKPITSEKRRRLLFTEDISSWFGILTQLLFVYKSSVILLGFFIVFFQNGKNNDKGRDRFFSHLNINMLFLSRFT